MHSKERGWTRTKEVIRHVGKITWSQMAILQALVMYLAVHREEGVEHEDKQGMDQLEPRHADKIPQTQMTVSLAHLTHFVVVAEVVDRVFSNKVTEVGRAL